MTTGARRAWPWAALPVAAVLAVDPAGLAPFGPIKWALVPALVLAGVALLVRDGRLRISGGAMPVFVAWTAVAALFGVDGLYAWSGTPERHFGVATWALVALCWWAGRSLGGSERRLVIATSALTAGVLGAWAVAEAVGWRPFDLVGIADRPVGTLGSSAFLGAAAVALTPAAIGWALQATGRVRVAAAAAAGFGLWALAASGARAALLAGVVVALTAIALHRDRRVVLTALACLAVGIVVAVASGASGRVVDVATDTDGGAQGRLDEWRVAVRVVADHPLTGVGPEGYRIAFGRSVDDRYEREHGRSPMPDRAHSAVLDVAATTGLPGAALYLVAVGTALGAAVRTVRRGSPVLAGAALGVIAYFVQSLFLFPIAELEPVVWLLAGMCAATVSSAPRRRRPLVSGAVAIVATAALLAGSLDVVADRRAKRSLALIADDTPAPADVASLRRDQVRYRLVDARVHESNGSMRGLERALRDVENALRVSPRDPVVRQEKGRLLLERARRGRDVGVARGYLAQLLRDDPHNAETWLRLGVAHELAGDDSGAIDAWRRAEYLAPDSAAASSNLAVAYARAGRTIAARAAATRALRRDTDNVAARRVLEEISQKDGTDTG